MQSLQRPPVVPPGWFTAEEWLRASAALQLSGRQQDVLSGVLAGSSDRKIAGDLRIAMPTVRSHLASLFRIVGVCDRTALVLEIVRIALDRPSGAPVISDQQIDD